jgi:hypothetical protein
MAPTQKFLGYTALMFWIPSVGAAIDLTGASRTFEWDEKGNSIDVSTRDDKQANSKAKLIDTPDRTFSASGLDTTPSASRVWRTINIGDTGQMLMYPLGSTGTGKPFEVANGIIQNRNYSTPYDNAATWKLDGELTSAFTNGTT